MNFAKNERFIVIFGILVFCCVALSATSKATCRKRGYVEDRLTTLEKAMKRMQKLIKKNPSGKPIPCKHGLASLGKAISKLTKQVKTAQVAITAKLAKLDKKVSKSIQAISSLKQQVKSIKKMVSRKCPYVCEKPLGMQNGKILDSQITASSVFASSYLPKYARLNHKNYAWAPKQSNTGKDWLQIDLLKTKLITKVATKGRGGEWVTKYQITHSLDCRIWTVYPKLLDGSKDGKKVKTNALDPFKARYIRFRPKKVHSWATMRVEIYGCEI